MKKHILCKIGLHKWKKTTGLGSEEGTVMTSGKCTREGCDATFSVVIDGMLGLQLYEEYGGFSNY